MKWSLKTTIFTGCALAVTILATVSGLSYWNTIRLVKTSQEVSDKHKVISEIQELIYLIEAIKNQQERYIVTADQTYFYSYQEKYTLIQRQLDLIEAITQNNPRHQNRIAVLKSLVNDQIDLIEKSMNLRITEGLEPALIFLQTGENQVVNEKIRQLIEQVQTEENRLLEQRTTAAIATTKNMIVAIVLSSIFAVGLVSLAGFILYQDVKKRRDIEEKLRTSEAQFSGIVDLAQDAIISFNQQQEIILFNRSAEHLFGYFAEEVIGQAFEMLLPPNYQVIYHQNIAEFADSTKTSHRTGKEWGEIQGIRKNGSEFPAEASISKLEVNSQQVFTVMLRDITQKKQAEKVLEETNQKLSGWVGELERYNRDLQQISVMSDLLQACVTVEEAYKVITSSLKRLFPHTSGGVFMMSESRHLVEAVVIWGNPESERLFTPNECWALRRGKRHLVEDINTDLLCQHLTSASVPLPVEYACIPMMAQGEAIGILHLSSQEKGKLFHAQKALAETVAEHIALALGNLKLREKLQLQNIRDPLTGLFNRRYLEESLAREIYCAERKKQTLGIIILDVDHFKQFNDTFGHEAGDLLLQELGLVLQTSIRKSDIACRYGGEEFLLMLPETNLETAQERAELLREEVKHINLHYRRQTLGRISISVGVAIFPEHGLTKDAVIRAADEALYRAKKEGRDRVFVASLLRPEE
ncbi:diguanylate cyclase [Capilliphycus salinus ALCB114379]|uniref:diguanylate cyclase n=1 Tax=Capilliphycus salinus TaxID=2768948 RepID=UPI0039A4B415